MSDVNRARTPIDIENSLARALAAEPTVASRSHIDARVEGALAAAQRRPARRDGLGLRLQTGLAQLGAAIVRPATGRRRLPVMIGAVVAVLLAGSAVAAGLGLLFQDAAGPVGSLRYAVDHATPVGASATDAGYRITLDRAYVDVNQVVVGLSISGPTSPTVGRPAQLNSARLIDSRGRTYTSLLGGTSSAHDLSANLAAYAIPPGDQARGPFTLEVTSLLLVDLPVNATAGPDGATENGTARAKEGVPTITGSWRFTFDVPDSGGVAGVPAGPVTRQGITARLEGIRFSPSMVSAVVSLEGLPAGSTWSAGGDFEHDGRRLGPLTYGTTTEGRTRIVMLSDSILPEQSGEWRVVIDEIVAVPEPGQTGETERIHGPWVLVVTAP